MDNNLLDVGNPCTPLKEKGASLAFQNKEHRAT